MHHCKSTIVGLATYLGEYPFYVNSKNVVHVKHFSVGD